MAAARALEARFERMSVNDENDPGDGGKHYVKAKVSTTALSRCVKC
jgi:aurora kinase